jgi:hypothetical protein
MEWRQRPPDWPIPHPHPAVVGTEWHQIRMASLAREMPHKKIMGEFEEKLFF